MHTLFVQACVIVHSWIAVGCHHFFWLKIAAFSQTSHEYSVSTIDNSSTPTTSFREWMSPNPIIQNGTTGYFFKTITLLPQRVPSVVALFFVALRCVVGVHLSLSSPLSPSCFAHRVNPAMPLDQNGHTTYCRFRCN